MGSGCSKNSTIEPTEQDPPEKPKMVEDKSPVVESGKEEFTFEHQAGGHGTILKVDKTKIMKPVSKKELEFYSSLDQSSKLASFAPKFYSKVEKEDKGKLKSLCQKSNLFLAYAELEDLTHYYKKPCIMDIKMGVTSVGI